MQVVLVPQGALPPNDWVVLVPIGAADFDGDGWPGEDNRFSKLDN